MNFFQKAYFFTIFWWESSHIYKMLIFTTNINVITDIDKPNWPQLHIIWRQYTQKYVRIILETHRTILSSNILHWDRNSHQKMALFCTLFDLATMIFDTAMKKTGQNIGTTYGLSYETLPSFLVMILADIFASDQNVRHVCPCSWSASYCVTVYCNALCYSVL